MTTDDRIARGRAAIEEGTAKAEAGAVARYNARAEERASYEADITAAELALADAESDVFAAEMALSEAIGVRDKKRDEVTGAVKRLEAAGFRRRPK